jgi:hypothetical protein
MVWYSKISGATTVARGGRSRVLLAHLDPYGCPHQLKSGKVNNPPVKKYFFTSGLLTFYFQNPIIKQKIFASGFNI